MNWKRVLLGVGVAALLLVGGVFIYLQFFSPQDETAVVAATPGATAERVDTLAVNVGADSVSAEGQIVPLRDARLAFAGAGQVAEIVAPEGTIVAAGDPILRLDTVDQENAVAQAQAGLQQAEANLAAAQAGQQAAEVGVRAAGVSIDAAQAQLALVTADPRPEEIALQQASIDVATARLNQAGAAQNAVLEGPLDSQIASAQAELEAAQAQAVPVREQLDEIRRQEDPDADVLAQAERDFAAAQAGITAAQAAVDELQSGATGAQRQAAGSGVAAAAAQRDAAQAELDLLLAGSQAEQVAIAEAGVTQAEAGLAEAEVRVQQAAASVVQAEAGVVQAQAALDAAQVALADRTLSAPFAGSVADITVEVGQVVPAGVPVVVLADLSGWQVQTTDLTELDVVAVAVGYPAEIRADALPNTVLTGTVTDIATVSQEVRGDITYVVTISLDEAAEGLRWGMTVFTTIDTAQ
jgi:HlyD family secretion protein